MLDGARPSYTLRERRLALQNARFEVFFDTIEHSAGGVVRDFLVVRPRIRSGQIGGICILPEIDGRIGLMLGHRHHLDAWLWQAPAGFVEDGELPIVTARRELVEEVGLQCAADDIVSLGAFAPDAGLIEAKVALFVARNCRPVDGAAIDREPGVGPLRFFDRTEVLDLVRTETEIGGSTLVACMRWWLWSRRDAN